MARNTIFDTVELTGSIQRLVDRPTVCNYRLTAHAGNTGDITVTNGSGSFTLSPRASSELYKGCDLYDLQVTGTNGDKIIYDGHTR